MVYYYMYCVWVIIERVASREGGWVLSICCDEPRGKIMRDPLSIVGLVYCCAFDFGSVSGLAEAGAQDFVI